MHLVEAMRLTHALLRPDVAAAAVEALRGAIGHAEVEGLVELIHHNRGARETVAALTALDRSNSVIVLDALLAALDSPHTTVRIGAANALRRRAIHTETVAHALHHRLRTDPSWLVRRAVLDALAALPPPHHWGVLDASDDPHWRVRHALLQTLLRWGEDADVRLQLEHRLQLRGDEIRTVGLREFLRWRWSGRMPESYPTPSVDPTQVCPFWDWDPTVLTRHLKHLGKTGRRTVRDVMPFLLGHDDERVRSIARETLADCGEADHLRQALALLDEPRRDAVATVAELFASMDLDRIEETAQLILARSDATAAQLAWALDQVRDTVDREEVESRFDPGMLSDPSPEVRAEAVRTALACGWDAAALTADADVRVRLALARGLIDRGNPDDEPLLRRLQTDVHPHVRAAALTPALAAELMAVPSRETSWHVLSRAARIAKVSFWKLEPQPSWQPTPITTTAVPSLTLDRRDSPQTRPLGPDERPVCPLGVSGHYSLPVEGFVRAFEAGVQLVFWEPNYRTLTEFLARLSSGTRREIGIVAGSFEADGERIRRDVERTLRALKVERLDLFLIFWVRSWARITDEMRETLDRLVVEGKLAAYSLSTHNRTLAIEAMNGGWNPVMVRHSAAHRGAEQQIFPLAVERGVSVITFNNTCYGRLLEPRGGLPAVRPSDCYRYTLMQPAVRCCWTAPATLAELEENFDVLRDPTLPEDRLRLLLAQGELLYREETIFRRLVRSL